MEQLSKTMKVEDFDIDLDFEMKLKFILSRAEQLVRQEGTALVESKSLTYSLQRKVVFLFVFIIHKFIQVESGAEQADNLPLNAQMQLKKMYTVDLKYSHSL